MGRQCAGESPVDWVQACPVLSPPKLQFVLYCCPMALLGKSGIGWKCWKVKGVTEAQWHSHEGGTCSGSAPARPRTAH